MLIKSGRGRLSSTNSLTEKTLRNCPCEYAAWPPSCQSPTCQRPAAIRPVPDFESIEWYSGISEICSQSRSRLHFCCGKHRASGEPLNPTGRAENQNCISRSRTSIIRAPPRPRARRRMTSVNASTRPRSTNSIALRSAKIVQPTSCRPTTSGTLVLRQNSDADVPTLDPRSPGLDTSLFRSRDTFFFRRG